MSVSILIGVTIIGINQHKLGFFSILVPTGTPLGLVPLLVVIETISYVARAISLGVRLGAIIYCPNYAICWNVSAPWPWPVPVTGVK